MNNYDEQVKRLTERPDRIHGEWSSNKGMFKFIEPKGSATTKLGGCLTLIRQGTHFAMPFGEVDKEFTDMIKEDQRLPRLGSEITPAHFPYFIEWLNILDPLIDKGINLSQDTLT